MDISWHVLSDVLSARAKQFYGLASAGLLLFLVCYMPLARKRKQPHRANVRLSTAQRISIRSEFISRNAADKLRDA